MERDTTLLCVRDFMNSSVRTLDAAMPIEDGMDQLRRWGFSGAPVASDGVVVGVLSEMDGMRVLADAAYYAIPEGTVGDHMTRDVDILRPNMDIFSVVALFKQTRHRRFPVVDDGMLVGIVTLRDIDHALWDMTQERHAKNVTRHPGAAWDEEDSRRRDQNR
jgi:CBS domain-containing protein